MVKNFLIVATPHTGSSALPETFRFSVGRIGIISMCNPSVPPARQRHGLPVAPFGRRVGGIVADDPAIAGCMKCLTVARRA